MAKKTHIEILKRGSKEWNDWRREYPDIIPDLVRADLSGFNLRFIDFSNSKLMSADLSNALPVGETRQPFEAKSIEPKRKVFRAKGASLAHSYILKGTYEVVPDSSRANLIGVKFEEADLRGAILRGADLSGADFTETDLSGADLSWARLGMTNLTRANLQNAILEKTIFHETIFNNTILKDSKGLETCYHFGPSCLDPRTIFNSENLPNPFLEGCGLPRGIIETIQQNISNHVKFHTCFISYSHAEEDFAKKLYSDLQDQGINCWYAPEDLEIGAKIRPSIDEAILNYDKLLLILSKNSIESHWVEKEVETAFEKECKYQRTVLFPIMLDNTAMETNQAWAADIRRTRHIGDFRKWTFPIEYKEAFERLLRDLSKKS